MTICSLVLQAMPQHLEAINEALNSMDGIEVHAQDDCGKMVVTIDHPSREYCSRAMTDMSLLKGVMSASLIFEYQEDLEKTSITPDQNQAVFEQAKTSVIQGAH